MRVSRITTKSVSVTFYYDDIEKLKHLYCIDTGTCAIPEVQYNENAKELGQMLLTAQITMTQKRVKKRIEEMEKARSSSVK